MCSRRRAGALAAALTMLAGPVAGLGGCMSAPSAAAPGELPPVYRGLDAYLHWDKLPYLDIGDRVAGWSTADPAGGNEDNRNVLGTLPGGGRILLDRAGPGVVTFLRMQEDVGGPWQLDVDGGPRRTIAAGDLGHVPPAGGPAAMLPYPLSLNTAQTQGSSVIAAPLPFTRSLRFASSSANGNFYALFRKLPIDVPPPENDAAAAGRVADLLRTAGTDIAPAGARREQGTASLGGPGTPSEVTTIGGAQQIRALTFRVPAEAAARFGNARLQVYWDGEATPSVDAPVKYLTGDGAGVYQPPGRQLVPAFPAGITGDGRTETEFAMYWPMPFTSRARIVLVSGGEPVPVSWSVRYEPFTDPPGWVGRFHANYVDVPHPTPGEDMTFLDVRGSGKLVGTVVNFGAVGGTLEGDPRIYLDDARTPQIAVTGTEEWGMGGNYWRNGKQTALPMAGLPSSTNNPPGSDVDGAALYRFLVADAIPFTSHIVVNWEHGAVNDSAQRYRASMLWYGTPAPSAERSDVLVPGAPESAEAHGYRSPGDRRYPLTSAHPYPVHAPPITGTVAATSEGATYTMALRPDNSGAFLRRTLDACMPNQRANVFVDGVFAGTWDTPGGQATPGSGRCWRDDDLPLPRSLTAGKRSVEIRIENAPAGDARNAVWTAADYALFSFLAPAR